MTKPIGISLHTLTKGRSQRRETCQAHGFNFSEALRKWASHQCKCRRKNCVPKQGNSPALRHREQPRNLARPVVYLLCTMHGWHSDFSTAKNHAVSPSSLVYLTCTRGGTKLHPLFKCSRFVSSPSRLRKPLSPPDLLLRCLLQLKQVDEYVILSRGPPFRRVPSWPISPAG